MTRLLPLNRPGWMRRAASWLRQAVESRRERRALRNEFAELRARGELDDILRDSGIAPSEVDRVLRTRPGAAQQLAAMMGRLGIDRSRLPHTAAMGAMLRDVEWQCAECREWRQCLAWLERGTSPEGYRAFCPNRARLEELSGRQAPPESAGSTRAPLTFVAK